MRRFFIDKKNINRDKFHITDEKTCKHMRNVLRLKAGDKVVLFDGEGNEYLGSLLRVQSNYVRGEIAEMKKPVQSNKPYLILAQSLPRAGKIDDIVRMNTEAGVSEFILFESEYSVAKLESYGQNKMQRLERLVTEASRQSERSMIPVVNTPQSFAEMLAYEADIKLLLHSKAGTDAVTIADIKAGLKPEQKVLFAIGPEGGFSPKEIELAIDSGFKTVHLDLPILRTETAGIAVSAILLY